MRTVPIHGTQLTTSRLGLGTSSLHHLLSPQARQHLLAHAWECGVRYFDTAPLYGHEMAERELGRFARGRRGEIVLATKFGLFPNPLLSALPPLMYAQKFVTRTLGSTAGRMLAHKPKRDYSARQVYRRVERSLRLMATDYLDILYLHEPTLAGIEAPEELLAALLQLRQSGKVRYLGISADLNHCSAITRQCPGLGEVWQVDVSSRPVFNGRPPQVTFGHLRSMGGGTEALERSLWRAVHTNTRGVILFSSRSTHHLEQTAAALAAIDSSQQKS